MHEEALTIIKKLNKYILEKNIEIYDKDKTIKCEENHISQLIEEYNGLENEFDELSEKSKWKIDLMNLLLDNYIDEYGVDDTICYLIGSGLSRKQFIELGFDEDDINSNFRRLSKYETEL